MGNRVEVLDRHAVWLVALVTPEFVSSVGSFQDRVRATTNPNFTNVRLVDEHSNVLCEAWYTTKNSWEFEVYPNASDEVLFRATLALADSPLRKKALLMQRIANLVQA